MYIAVVTGTFNFSNTVRSTRGVADHGGTPRELFSPFGRNDLPLRGRVLGFGLKRCEQPAVSTVRPGPFHVECL
jgi:hypothetical protein